MSVLNAAELYNKNYYNVKFWYNKNYYNGKFCYMYFTTISNTFYKAGGSPASTPHLLFSGIGGGYWRQNPTDMASVIVKPEVSAKPTLGCWHLSGRTGWLQKEL